MITAKDTPRKLVDCDHEFSEWSEARERSCIACGAVLERTPATRKHITTTLLDDERAIGYIEAVIRAREMVEGQTQWELLQLVKRHIKNMRSDIDCYKRGEWK
jgi:hypothetical protein